MSDQLHVSGQAQILHQDLDQFLKLAQELEIAGISNVTTEFNKNIPDDPHKRGCENEIQKKEDFQQDEAEKKLIIPEKMAMDIQQNDVPAERKKQTDEDLDSCNKQTVFKQPEDEEQDALKSSFETEEESRGNKDSINGFLSIGDDDDDDNNDGSKDQDTKIEKRKREIISYCDI